MEDKDKIALMDYIIKYLQDKVTSDDMPIMVGTLNKPQGINGFKNAYVGHPVFEFKERYIIYLESNDGKTKVSVPYHKETFKSVVNFVKF